MIFGSRNDRIVKKYLKRVKDINKLESKYEKLTDNELKEAFNRLKANVKSGDKSLDEALNDSFAITREARLKRKVFKLLAVQLFGLLARLRLGMGNWVAFHWIGEANFGRKDWKNQGRKAEKNHLGVATSWLGNGS